MFFFGCIKTSFFSPTDNVPVVNYAHDGHSIESLSAIGLYGHLMTLM